MQGNLNSVQSGALENALRVVQDWEIRFWSVVNTVQDAKDFLLEEREVPF